MALDVGSVAPDFTLPDEEGNAVRLYDVLKNGPVMLVFYPGDFTPTCTKQLCSYRDNYSEFQEFGVQILGISDDSVEKHAKFREKKSFQFPLLADPQKQVINQYSGSGLLALGRAHRANYIITPDHVVQYAHVEKIAVFHRKSDEILEVLKGLKSRGKLNA